MVIDENSSPVPSDDVSFSGTAVLHGMRRLLPVSLFVAPFGVAFGVSAVEHGLGPIQVTAMSLLVFSATVQFAALEFLNEPVAYGSLFLVALALNARHVIMGAALSRWVNRLPFARRLATLTLLSDANFADTQPMLHKGETDLGVLLGGGLMLWIAWVASTAMGAFGGDLLGDTEVYGFGAVMVCFFAATVVRMLRASSGLVLPAAVAMVISGLTLPLLPTGWNIIAAAITGGALAVMLHAE